MYYVGYLFNGAGNALCAFQLRFRNAWANASAFRFWVAASALLWLATALVLALGF